PARNPKLKIDSKALRNNMTSSFCFVQFASGRLAEYPRLAAIVTTAAILPVAVTPRACDPETTVAEEQGRPPAYPLRSRQLPAPAVVPASSSSAYSAQTIRARAPLPVKKRSPH